jgi:hypothetical protein
MVVHVWYQALLTFTSFHVTQEMFETLYTAVCVYSGTDLRVARWPRTIPAHPVPATRIKRLGLCSCFGRLLCRCASTQRAYDRCNKS